jgi:mycofactocin precursor
MSGQTLTVTETAEPEAPPANEVPEAETSTEPEVTLQDMLVEDVSIDGMCGVY